MNKLFLAVTTLLLLPCANLFSQEWSAAQREVWKTVEAYWALYDAGNLEGYLAYLHNDYAGWGYRSALPEGKAGGRKFLEYGLKTEKTILSNIKPVAIGVFGDFAYVHYYYDVIYKDVEGKQKSESGRWTDILMKQGDKWVVIGDHGGRTSKE